MALFDRQHFSAFILGGVDSRSAVRLVCSSREISIQGEGALQLVQLSINSKLSYWKRRKLKLCYSKQLFFCGTFHNIFKLDTRCTYSCIGTSGKKLPKPPWEGFSKKPLQILLLCVFTLRFRSAFSKWKCKL